MDYNEDIESHIRWWPEGDGGVEFYDNGEYYVSATAMIVGDQD